MYKYDRKEKQSFVYTGYTPLEAKDISSVIFYCTSLPFHVCLNEISMSSVHQATFSFIKKDY